MGDDVVDVIGAFDKEVISIHIPRVGDDLSEYDFTREEAISIHIPRVGDDVTADVVAPLYW